MTIARGPELTMADQHTAMRDGTIVGFVCKDDGHMQVGPMVRCPKCHGTNIEKKEFSSKGKVVSYTIQTVASEQYLNETPFAFAIIQLEDGPKVSGWIPWIARPSDLPMGSDVVYSPSYKGGMQFEKA